MVKKNSSLPVFIGSGITTDNMENYWENADGFIVGSHFKKDGKWYNTVDKERINRFMKKFSSLV
jgi:predicted TIM-barrel enzyme